MVAAYVRYRTNKDGLGGLNRLTRACYVVLCEGRHRKGVFYVHRCWRHTGHYLAIHLLSIAIGLFQGCATRGIASNCVLNCDGRVV